MSQPVEVFKRAGGETRIVVKEYPNPQAALKVFSADDRGRRLEAVGWNNTRSKPKDPRYWLDYWSAARP